jgi:SAM-dependent methyltransferase
MGNSWYSEQAGFFGPNYIEEFAYVFDPERIKREVDFVEKIINYNHSLKILDLACGNGRHSIELARRGYNMTGLDLNSFFLEQAAIATKEAGVTVRWIRSDMRQIPFEGEMDAIVFLFSSFGYLESDRDDQIVLNQIAKALRSGGEFVMDFINREWIMRNYRSNDWRELPNGAIILMQRNFDLATGRNHEKRIRISPDGKREEVTMVVRMYTVVELIKMCEAAGLQIQDICGGYNIEPLTIESKFIVLRAKKPNR